MLSIESEKRLSSLLAWGGALVALIVTDRISLDPVNVGKMATLTVFAGALLALMLTKAQAIFRESKPLLIVLLALLLSFLISILLSDNSWERGFFGAYGRNTGLLTYFALSIFLLSSSIIKKSSNVVKVLNGLFLVGFVNLIYNLLVISGNDIFTWKNPYGTPIGTFGNPNFISSFTGMFIVATVGYSVFYLKSLKIRIIYLIQIPISVFIIYKTGSIQGYIVTLLGSTLIAAFYLWFKLKNKMLFSAFCIFALTSGVVGILGMLQKGPLSAVLYKPSVTYRGEYWAAGINMGLNKPFFGQGLDSYGTYYRLYREPSAMIAPGPSVSTDTAHNVFIDIFSGSGFIGLILYTLVIGLALFSSFKVIKRMKSPDGIFIALFTSWVCYLAQSVISINQIGLAVWGWILTGLIIGYPLLHDSAKIVATEGNAQRKKIRKSKEPNVVTAGTAVSIFVGAIVATLVALPPFVTDAKMRDAINKNDAESVKAQASAFPVDTLRVNRAAVALARGGMTQLAREVTQVATSKYPDDFAGWFTLYELTPAADPQRAVLKAKLHEIDPLNPEFQK
jgi:O-antigen ligase